MGWKSHPCSHGSVFPEGLHPEATQELKEQAQNKRCSYHPGNPMGFRSSLRSPFLLGKLQGFQRSLSHIPISHYVQQPAPTTSCPGQSHSLVPLSEMTFPLPSSCPAYPTPRSTVSPWYLLFLLTVTQLFSPFFNCHLSTGSRIGKCKHNTELKAKEERQ